MTERINRPVVNPVISHGAFFMVCPQCTRAYTDNRRQCPICEVDLRYEPIIPTPMMESDVERAHRLTACALCGFRYLRTSSDACPSCGHRTGP